MIAIRAELCTGCGVCVGVCPTGALYLVEGRAAVDTALCNECQACIEACPSGAIVPAAPEGPMPEINRLPALRPEAEVIGVRSSPSPVPLRFRAWPMVGAALAWAGREILPRLADVMLDALDRRTTETREIDKTHSRETPASAVKDNGRQHRHRRRKGSG